MTNTLSDLLEKMWTDYCELNPQAKKIQQALIHRGETVINDHIALRTINHPRLGIESLAKQFKALGYEAVQNYQFKEKKLFAWHFEHKTDPKQPKIFISELELQHFSSQLQMYLNQIADSIPHEMIDSNDFSVSGRSWDISFKDYESLATESEYAAWFAAFGFRPNHFTVSMNDLKTFNGLPDINQFILDLGYPLNESGGQIKGSPKELLEQSSTLAAQIEVDFSDGKHKIPSCYYEFALRYPTADGKLYQGFVAASADKIFESTNRTSN